MSCEGWGTGEHFVLIVDVDGVRSKVPGIVRKVDTRRHFISVEPITKEVKGSHVRGKTRVAKQSLSRRRVKRFPGPGVSPFKRTLPPGAVRRNALMSPLWRNLIEANATIVGVQKIKRAGRVNIKGRGHQIIESEQPSGQVMRRVILVDTTVDTKVLSAGDQTQAFTDTSRKVVKFKDSVLQIDGHTKRGSDD